jgi:hypothetical protein
MLADVVSGFGRPDELDEPTFALRAVLFVQFKIDIA